jgi:hypothetical protein
MNRATAIVITSITSFVVFMISFSSPCEILQLDQVAVPLAVACMLRKSPPIRSSKQPDAAELSSSNAAQLGVSTLAGITRSDPGHPKP